jgi:hypothetical protein
MQAQDEQLASAIPIGCYPKYTLEGLVNTCVYSIAVNLVASKGNPYSALGGLSLTYGFKLIEITMQMLLKFGQDFKYGYNHRDTMGGRSIKDLHSSGVSFPPINRYCQLGAFAVAYLLAMGIGATLGLKVNPKATALASIPPFLINLIRNEAAFPMAIVVA